jgi:hypothetical protein
MNAGLRQHDNVYVHSPRQYTAGVPHANRTGTSVVRLLSAGSAHYLDSSSATPVDICSRPDVRKKQLTTVVPRLNLLKDP